MVGDSASSPHRICDSGSRGLTCGPSPIRLALRRRSDEVLDRDPRVLVHSVITSRDGGEGELKVRGLVRVWSDPQTQGRYAETAARSLGWRPEPGRFHLFSVDIAQVTFIRYDAETGDQHVALWPPAREFVRPGTTETSVGAPEPESGLLTKQ
jgi:hypothetical protein